LEQLVIADSPETKKEDGSLKKQKQNRKKKEAKKKKRSSCVQPEENKKGESVAEQIEEIVESCSSSQKFQGSQ